MLRNPHDFTGPVNLGNPSEFTILQLAEKVIQLTDSRSKIVFKPLPADDPTQRRPNIELARQKLGWQPTIELEEGLQRTIDYFKAFIANKSI
jgi:UDP-glucuronate decarboxylase